MTSTSGFMAEQQQTFKGLAFFLVFLLCIIEASCHCLIEKHGVSRRFYHDNGSSLPITIAVGSHASHSIISNILKILLEDIAGYQEVQLVQLSKVTNLTDTLLSASGCKDKTANSGCGGDHEQIGSVPQFMVNLESWIGVDNRLDFEDWSHKNQLSNAGLLGPFGRLGWYVSEAAYMELWNEQQLLASDILALRLDVVARKLSLEGVDLNPYLQQPTGTKTPHYCLATDGCINGIYVPVQCQGPPIFGSTQCATLLVAEVEYGLSSLKQVIDSMQLKVKVAYLGSHLRDFIMTVAVPRNMSVLLFDRALSSLTTRTEAFRRIALPDCAVLTSNRGDSGGTCEFELHEIRKIMWTHLARREPVLRGFVKGMRWSADAYARLVHAYGSCEYLRLAGARGGASPHWQATGDCLLGAASSLAGDNVGFARKDWDARFACKWVEANGNLWRSWVPSDASKKPKLYVGGMFPVSPGAWRQPNIIPAALLAIELINQNDSILPEYELELIVKDSNCRSDYALKAFIEYVQNSVERQLIGILGPACADTAITIAAVAKHYNMVMISYSVETIISTEERNASYPYFFRTVPQINEYALVYGQLFRNFSWHHVATIVDDLTRDFHVYHIILQNAFRDGGITISAQIKISSPKPNTPSASRDISKYLEDIQRAKAQVIIADFYEPTARLVMCEAYKMKMTAAYKYVWFLPGIFGFDWYDTDYYNHEQYENVNCTTAEMFEAVKGYFSLSHAFVDEDSKEIVGNMTVGTWKAEYERKMKEYMNSSQTQMPHYISDFGGYAYDAVWAYALALNQLNAKSPSYLRNIHSEQSTTKLVQMLYDTRFDGASGPIEFTENGDRHGIVHIKQYVKYSYSSGIKFFAPTIVGVWKPVLSETHSDVLELYGEEIVWLAGAKPVDQVTVTSLTGGLGNSCSVESFRQLLNVSCEAAIAVAFVIGFSILLTLVLLIVTLIKRHYDREMRTTQQRLVELGLYMKDIQGNGGPPPWLGLDEWEVPRDCVVLNRKLGEGAFGTVYGGEARGVDGGGDTGAANVDWVAVAVKTLKVGSTAEEKLDFLSEAETMKRFEHKNIVKLLGVCTQGEPAYAIMEFMLHGDLKTFLLSRRQMVSEDTKEAEDISARSLTRMAVDIICGLTYMHEHQYVHRDLACRNCLVSASKTVKIGDFGMARPLYDNGYYKFTRKGRLPVRWMAPESLCDGIFTYRSDCWSFGILLYEIVTFGSFPYQGLSNSQVLDHVKAGKTLKVPQECTDEMKALLFRCWAFDAAHRPTSENLHSLLLSNPELLQPLIAPPDAAAIPEYESAEMDLSPQPFSGIKPLLMPAAATNSSTSRRLPLHRPPSSVSMELFRKSRSSSESTKLKVKRKSSNSLLDGVFLGAAPASPDSATRSPSLATLRPSSPPLQAEMHLSAFTFAAVAEERNTEYILANEKLIVSYSHVNSRTSGSNSAAKGSTDCQGMQPLLASHC